MDLVQPAPPGLEADSPPLVLIHDGGGTVVSYFHMGSLDRDVYAIPNPHFYSGDPWEYGLPEMAREYTKFIKSEIPSGQILLGGWSLGGHLSLEIASILARSSDIQVLGIIMIDSVFPPAAKTDAENVVPAEPIFGISTNAMIRAQVSHAMNQANAMVKMWPPPVWKGCKDPEAYARRVKLDEVLAEKLGSLDDADNEATKSKGDTAAGMDNLPSAPPTILLRCKEHVPVTDSDKPNAIGRVDVLRDREKLGWDDYGYGLISAVLEIPGHHFNIFTDDYVDDVTTRVKLACRMLERANL